MDNLGIMLGLLAAGAVMGFLFCKGLQAIDKNNETLKSLRKTVVYVKQGAGGLWRWYAYLPTQAGQPGPSLCDGGITGHKSPTEALQDCMFVLSQEWDVQAYKFTDEGDEHKHGYVPPTSAGTPIFLIPDGTSFK